VRTHDSQIRKATTPQQKLKKIPQTNKKNTNKKPQGKKPNKQINLRRVLSLDPTVSPNRLCCIVLRQLLPCCCLPLPG